MKYQIGDSFRDNKTGEIIEIIGITKDEKNSNDGYEVKCDGVYWEYGLTEIYLDNNCTRLTKCQ